MKHIFTEAAQGILTLDVQPTTWGAGWWVGSWGFSVMVFVAFGVFCCFGFACCLGFFKNVHLRKNLGYLRAGTKPKVCQMTDIYNKALYAHLHLNSGSYCKLPTQAFISVV